MPLVQLHNTSFSPVGLWQFDGNLNDSSGNGFTLSVFSGTERYATLLPGLKGVLLIDSSLEKATYASALAITGNLTIECFLSLPYYSSSTAKWLIGHEDSGETPADNCLYSIQMLTATNRLGFFSESGSGVDASYELTDVLPPTTLCHFAMTRISNVIRFYVNGRPFGSPSGTLTPPTDGTDGRFSIGSRSLNAPDCTLASLKILNVGLSASQIAGEYNRTLGTLYGIYLP